MDKSWRKDDVIRMADTRVIGYSGGVLCENYREPLGRCETAAQALRLYKNCISWALLERYPTMEDLLGFADRDVLAENGVYVGMTFDGERIDGHVCCVFLNCRGWIRTGLNVERGIIPMLYMSEGCDMKVVVDEGLRRGVPVELYYGSRVGGHRGRLDIKNHNREKGVDNRGFTEEMLSVKPDMENEDL